MFNAYLSSVSPDLVLHRDLALEEVRALGGTVETVNLSSSAPRVEECRRAVEAADVVLGFLGWNRGPVPDPELGGDDSRPYLRWELDHALKQGKPVLVMMADDSWPEHLRERHNEGQALMRDLRAEFQPLALPLQGPVEEAADFERTFRERLRSELDRLMGTRSMKPREMVEAPAVDSEAFTVPEHSREPWPERPYPLLLPYRHPELFAGRESELEELVQLLEEPTPILGLHSPSGAGKSSLLQAGLIPRLRTSGRPVALDRNPHEPGLADRLLGDLTLEVFGSLGELPPGRSPLITHLLAMRRRRIPPPLLILDQFEEVLRSSDRRSRATAGPLLAASAQRVPGGGGPLCRWLLAYRQEFHGEVVAWLGDVLREARAVGVESDLDLPHDLSGTERFHSWALPPLGALTGIHRTASAQRAFQEAIERPLSVRLADGSPRYAWHFLPGDAERLARVFVAARKRRPEAPLVPELQVVLAQLMERAEEAEPEEGSVALQLPDDPASLVKAALEDHLRRVLAEVFPARRGEEDSLLRTRALLALRELVDAEGRRQEALPAETLARALGEDGEEILAQLAGPTARILVAEQTSVGWSYALSHDRMAEVILRVVEEESRLNRPQLVEEFHRRLGIDERLLALRRFVSLKSELFRSGETEQATAVSGERFRRIEEHADALLWGGNRQDWWQACRIRRSREQRRNGILGFLAAGILCLVAYQAALLAIQQQRLQAQFEEVQWGKPGPALQALYELSQESPEAEEELANRLHQRKDPKDLLESGLGDLSDPTLRDELVLRVVKLLLPQVNPSPEGYPLIGTMVWALDAFPARDPKLAPAAQELRRWILEPLRQRYPPPSPPPEGHPAWVRIPAGSFAMGTTPGEPWGVEDHGNEYPQHQVTLSSFRMQAHEVTNQEFRRLFPEHSGNDEFPAITMSWYEANTYAAWLGGRLPTEAEWEYAARAGCRYEFCGSDGREVSPTTVAWIRRNTTDPVTLSPAIQPVAQLEANPWGIYDLHGNVSEWTLSWHGKYSSDPKIDPWGPPSGDGRVMRGGLFFLGLDFAHTSHRTTWRPWQSFPITGFRVVLPDG